LKTIETHPILDNENYGNYKYQHINKLCCYLTGETNNRVAMMRKMLLFSLKIKSGEKKVFMKKNSN
jgi:hypothetical protein